MQRVLALYIPFLAIERRFAQGEGIVDCGLPIVDYEGKSAEKNQRTGACIADSRSRDLTQSSDLQSQVRGASQIDKRKTAITNPQPGSPQPLIDKKIEGQALAGAKLANRQSPIANFSSAVATVAPQGQTIRIIHVNPAARQAYVRPGQTLAEAKAVVPELVTFTDDPVADSRQIESLAVWAQCFSPLVHIEGADTLLLDVTGCERLFHGEDNLARQAVAGLAERGFSARAAIAETPGAAWAIAHAHRESIVITERSRDVSYLAPLPAASLRLDSRKVEALHSVGVETIGSLLHLPRSSLTSRFGESVLERLDQALGDLPEILSPYQPKPVMSSRLEFGGTTDRVDVLLEAVRQATSRFCEQLNRQTAGVRQLFITFYCPNVPSAGSAQTRRVTLEVSLSRPTRSAGHLLSLLKVKLERLQLPGPADALAAWARQIEKFDDPQIELFESGSQDARTLTDLLDRLVVRLGAGSVLRPRLVMDYQPERAFAYESVLRVKSGAAAQRRNGGRSRGKGIEESRDQGSQESEPKDRAFARPLRLLSMPLRIAATSIVPDGPPIAFGLHGEHHAVRDCIGPERIETGWWRGKHIRRDYFRIITDVGRHGWIFRARETGHWFMQGWFE